MHLHHRILLSTGSHGHDLPPPPPFPPSHQLHSHVIIALASAAAASLFLAFVYYAVLRHRLRRPPSLPSADLSAARDPASDADHPFWHVRTVGLDAAAIESIGSYAHRSGDRTLAADCTVCLAEVTDGEIVRLLPKCGHVFHVHCIDAWLLCHVTCPLCRATVAVDAADVDGEPLSPEFPQSDEGGDVGVRVSVDSMPEVPDGPGTISLDTSLAIVGIDEEKEGNCSNCGNCSKDEGVEKGQSESGRGFLFSRLGRARSSSVLPL